VNCDPELSLFGCEPLQTCRPIEVKDTCQFDVSACSAVIPGAVCLLMCKAPYVGEPTYGHCMGDNTEIGKRLGYKLPSCRPICDVPDPLPNGYNKTANGQIVCAHGYVGTVATRCNVDDSCVAKMTLSGCVALAPCASIESQMSPQERCQYNIAACPSLGPGETCRVECRAPFLGSYSYAGCPQRNTDPDRPLTWTRQDCTMDNCADPLPTPDGYMKDADGTWRCSQGYVGVGRRSCEVSEDCVVEAVLRGCKPAMPCAAPPANISKNTCPLDVSDCPAGPVQRGESCTVKCLAPFALTSAVATCPMDNSDADRIVPGADLQCECPDPIPVPLGYVKSAMDWHCKGGYVGVAVKSCACGTANSTLTGCAAPVPCGAAGFWDADRRKGYISGVIDFGPSHQDGLVSEIDVARYKVFFADACGEKMGEVLGSVQSVTTRRGESFFPQECCRENAYRARISTVWVPEGAAGLFIVAETTSGDSPVGFVAKLTDISDDGGRVAVGLQSRASRPVAALGSGATLVAVVAALTAVLGGPVA